MRGETSPTRASNKRPDQPEQEERRDAERLIVYEKKIKEK